MIKGNETIAIIGDIHGCFDTFMKLKEKLPTDCRIISVGDIIDRGKQIEQTIDYFREHEIEMVLGNHEHMAMEAVEYLYHYDESDRSNYNLFGTDWMYNGGKEMLRQYSSKEKLIKDIESFRSLPIAFDTKIVYNGLPVIVSHAQLPSHFILCDFPILQSDTPYGQSLVWNRHVSVTPTPFFNVHGHTPTDCYGKNSEPILTKYFLNLDTGCCYDISTRQTLTAALFIPDQEEIQIIQERRV